MSDFKDYYKTLGVGKSADEAEIKKAYRKLAKEHHPDRNKGKAASETKFKEINEAYEVLSDPEKRQVYDQYGSSGGKMPQPPPGGWNTSGNVGDFSDFFQTLFGGGFGGSRGGGGYSDLGDIFGQQGRAPSFARDVEGTLNIALTEAYRGTTRAVQIGEKRLEVRVPAGAKDNQKLRLAGQGPGGGNVLLTIKLESDPTFRLEGDDVRVKADVPAPVAVIGGKIDVLTLDGRVELGIPAHSQAGRVMRLRGQGWPKRDGTRGDQLVELRITVPKHPSKEELELYEQLANIKHH
jgi:curved DNA-binding protein